jgi:hypothetical protein
MAFTQGAPLPDITETTTKTQAAPDYYTNYLTGLSQAGNQALYTGALDAAGKPVMKSGADLVASLDPLQNKAYANIEGAADDYKTGLTNAQATANAVASGLTPARITSLMNPYTSGVVNEMARLQQKNIQERLMPTLKAGFVGSGGLGSQRYANALGQTSADWQSNLLGAQTGALQKGYETAVNAALQEMGQQNQAAQIQGGLAKSAQELALNEIGALEKAGATKQAYEQAKLDAPLKVATAASNLMAGKTIPMSDTQRFVGPKAGSYQISDLASILGVMSTLGAMKAGSPGEQALGAIGKGISGFFGGGGPNASAAFSGWLQGTNPSYTPTQADWNQLNQFYNDGMSDTSLVDSNYDSTYEG